MRGKTKKKGACARAHARWWWANHGSDRTEVARPQLLKEPRPFSFLAGLEAEALAAYEKSRALEPGNPEILNNQAWLLITASDPEVLDAPRALALAEQATALRPTASYILDTLAAAYWANNLIDEALEAERAAIKLDPANRPFYRRQMDFYLNNTWPADLKGWAGQE